jgi:hypothetical protein
VPLVNKKQILERKWHRRSFGDRRFDEYEVLPRESRHASWNQRMQMYRKGEMMICSDFTGYHVKGSVSCFSGWISSGTVNLRFISMLCDITRRCASVTLFVCSGFKACLSSFQKKGCGISLDRSKDAENLKQARHWHVKKEIDMMLCNAVFV